MRFSSRIKLQWVRLKREDGSFTIESALLLPVTILLLIGALFLFVLSAHMSLTYVTAEETANRTAHVWDNSYKHPVTGMFTTMEFDPLYWRWLNDGAEQWFGFVTGNEMSTVTYPREPEADTGTTRLTEKKLSIAADSWPVSYTGMGGFRNAGFTKSVSMMSIVPFRAPGMFGLDWADAVSGTSSELIIEPAEFIRNIELLIGYIPVVRQKLEGDALRNTLSPWLDRQDPIPDVDRSLSFQHHTEAVKYLRALVRGKEQRMPTQSNGKWRLLDAVDKHGVVHQAYIGPKSLNKDVTSQMLKDAELIREGKVSGIVWHFFRRTGDSSAGPSASLKRELQKHGIIVVVHA
jgi:hypothetical protein